MSTEKRKDTPAARRMTIKPLCSMCQQGTTHFCLDCLGCQHTCTCTVKRWADSRPIKERQP